LAVIHPERFANQANRVFEAVRKVHPRFAEQGMRRFLQENRRNTFPDQIGGDETRPSLPHGVFNLFFADSLAHGLPDSSFDLLDSSFALALFISHAEVPR
jgi:hypothetical protein